MTATAALRCVCAGLLLGGLLLLGMMLSGKAAPTTGSVIALVLIVAVLAACSRIRS